MAKITVVRPDDAVPLEGVRGGDTQTVLNFRPCRDDASISRDELVARRHLGAAR